MEIYFYFAQIIFGITIIVCVGLYFLNLNFTESNLFFQSQNHRLLTYKNKIILYGAYIGIYIAFQQGSLFLLSWLPNEWGVTSDSSGFTKLENYISYLLGFTSLSFIIRIESLYLYKTLSKFKDEEKEYYKIINNPYADIKSLQKEIQQKLEAHEDFLSSVKLDFSGGYKYFSEEKAFIYRKILKEIESQHNSDKE